MSRSLAFYLSISVGLAFGQENPVAKKYASLIKAEALRDNLNIIASDALEGRYTGSRGQKMAAAFIANHFQQIGLEAPVNGSYYQTFPLYSNVPGNTYVQVSGNRYENYGDVLYLEEGNSKGEINTPMVFAGYGRPEDFAQIDINNKAVLVLTDNFYEPAQQKLTEILNIVKKKGAKYFFALPLTPDSEFNRAADWYKSYSSNLTMVPEQSEDLGWCYLKSIVAEKIFSKTFAELRVAAKAEPSKKALKKLKPGNINFQIQTLSKTISTENVLGYLSGTDKKDELVIVTAHYDHIGKKPEGTGDIINNGADDDGSGTVAVLQMAQAFAEAKKNGVGPRRSILFMIVTGEEEGLLGSEYYAEHPIFPLATTVVDLNIDMIGRSLTEFSANKNYLYVIGADKLSSELHNINEQMNTLYTHLNFDYKFNDENHPDRLYYRSDHWNFAKNGIPVIFYFDGIHEDYHRVSDEVSKIDFDLLALRTRCIFFTAWELSNRPERLKIDKR